MDTTLFYLVTNHILGTMQYSVLWDVCSFKWSVLMAWKLMHISFAIVLLVFHDGVIKWKHFTRYWPFVRGIHRSPVHSLHKGQWHTALILSCDQAALWMVFSVRLSVCPSVTPFWLCSHHRIIMKFSGVITKDQGKVHAKGQGQSSKVKVTEVTTQLNRFRTVTAVWIHIWWWNDTYSLMLLRRGALLFFKVIRQISRSHGTKNPRIWPRLGVSGL